MKTLLLFLFILPLKGYTQSATIHELKFKIQRESNPGYFDSIIYPIVVTGIDSVDQRINRTLRDSLLYPDLYESANEFSITQLIDSFIANGLDYLSYDLSYNRNGLLSIRFSLEATAAYSVNWSESFNFNTSNGQAISLSELIDPQLSQSFEKFLYQKKSGAIDSAISELKSSEDLTKDDSEDVANAIELMNECMKSLLVREFYIIPSGVVIIEDCDFPHFIQAFEPVLQYTLTRSEMAAFLKPELYNKIMN